LEIGLAQLGFLIFSGCTVSVNLSEALWFQNVLNEYAWMTLFRVHYSHLRNSCKLLH